MRERHSVSPSRAAAAAALLASALVAAGCWDTLVIGWDGETSAAEDAAGVGGSGVDTESTGGSDSATPAGDLAAGGGSDGSTIDEPEGPTTDDLPYAFVEVGPIVVVPGLIVFDLGTFGIGGLSFPDAFIVAYATDQAIVLELTDVAVYPAAGHGLRFADPAFAIYPPGVDDPDEALVDTPLQGGAVTYWAPDANVLGTGEVLLTSWTTGARLALRFFCWDSDCDANPPIELL